MNNIEYSIEQIEKLESRARDLQAMLDSVESRWNKHMATVKDSPQWLARCERTGVVKRYNFGDILC